VGGASPGGTHAGSDVRAVHHRGERGGSTLRGHAADPRLVRIAVEPRWLVQGASGQRVRIQGKLRRLVLGFYRVSPDFKTRGDGTTAPGADVNESFTAFNDRLGLLKNGQGVDLTITADRATSR
jgi:hypothetical protein